MTAMTTRELDQREAALAARSKTVSSAHPPTRRESTLPCPLTVERLQVYEEYGSARPVIVG